MTNHQQKTLEQDAYDFVQSIADIDALPYQHEQDLKKAYMAGYGQAIHDDPYFKESADNRTTS